MACRALSFLLLLSTCLLTIDARALRQRRQKLRSNQRAGLNQIMPLVLGGKPANPKVTASMALIRLSLVGGGSRICSGTIVRPDVILTAAHCMLFNRSRVLVERSVVFPQQVSLNTTGVQGHRISEIFVHRQYSPSGSLADFRNDIALVRMSTPVPSNRFATLVIGEAPKDGMRVVVAGYGKVSPTEWATELQQGMAINRNFDVCLADAPESLEAILHKFYFVCTVNTRDFGVCSGDSGGGLFYFASNSRLVQFGISSFISGGCGEEGALTFYTNLNSYEEDVWSIGMGLIPYDYVRSRSTMEGSKNP